MTNHDNHNQINGRPAVSPGQFFSQLESIARQLQGIARDLSGLLAQLTGLPGQMMSDHSEVNASGANDRMLTVDEVAARMGLSRDYVYHRAKHWPFRRKLSARALRFSELGLEAWLTENGRNSKSVQNEMDVGDEESSVGGCVGVSSWRACSMTPEMRSALRLAIETYPAGSTVPVLREHALELLEGALAIGEEVSGPPPADLTVKQLANRLGRKPSTCRGWCERGLLAGAYRWAGSREWRIPLAGVLAFEEGQRTQRLGSPRSKPFATGSGRPVDLGSWRAVS